MEWRFTSHFPATPSRSLLDTGLCPECHWHSSYLVEGEPALAEVFLGGADMIDGVRSSSSRGIPVDAEVAVVDAVILLHVDGRVLGVPHCI